MDGVKGLDLYGPQGLAFRDGVIARIETDQAEYYCDCRGFYHFYHFLVYRVRNFPSGGGISMT
jgi:hypothetical protein